MSSGGHPSSGAPAPPLKKTFRPFKASSASSSTKSDWLAASILIAKTATAAGEFAPFPYIKGAFGTLLTFIEAVEKLNRNQEDLKELCENINEIVDILRDQISTHGDAAAVKLQGQCQEFEEILQGMLRVVKKMQKQNQLIQFFRSSSIGSEITGYEKRVQRLLSLIQLLTGLSTNTMVMDISATTTDVKSKVNDIHAMLSPNLDRLHIAASSNNCPPPSRIFHGREKILAKMQEYFTQDPGKQHIYVLYGLGGAGKTQIALKFIQQSSRFTNIFFVDASTIETIETGFKNIAKLQNTGNSSDDAVKWLVTKDDHWLVFFDNADDPKLDLHKFLPQCTHGNILMTTRNPELRMYGSASEVSDLEEQDAIALLLTAAAVEEETPKNEKIAADIVKVLWYLPLAIVQAGAFIAKSGTLDRYLLLYAKNRDELLRKKPAQSQSDYKWTVYTTWQMSFDQLSGPAAMFLQLCSFLHREGISEDIFSRAANYHFTSLDPPEEELEQPLKFLSQFQGPDGEWDTLAFLEVTTEIMSYSLATFAPEKRTFSIHPLVHQWSRDILGDPESVYCIMYSILGMSIRGIPEIHSQLASLKLLPHLDAVMQFKEFVGPDFNSAYGFLYSWAERHQEAKAFRISALEKQRTLKSDDDLATLYLMHSLAVTYERLGQLKEAEELVIVVVEKRRAILGEDHPETLDAMYSLAVTYWNDGQFQKAEELGVVVVEKRRAILGEDHPDTLDVMSNLAITYKKLGQPQKAEELEVVVVEKLRAILGEDHPKTLDAMYNLAITYNSLGQPQKAEELEVVVVEKLRAILGVDHPNTLDAMYNLAITYKDLGQPQKAEELEVVVVEKRKAILGEDHPNTLDAMYNLANTYCSLGQLEKAEDLELIVVEKRRAILGADHPDTLDAMYNLALTYKSLGQPQKAEELEVVVVDKRRAILGADHLGTLLAMGNLAVAYYHLHRFEDAEKLLIEVTKKQRVILGNDHPDTLRTMANLASTYRALGKVAEAKELEGLLLDDEVDTSASDAVE